MPISVGRDVAPRDHAGEQRSMRDITISSAVFPTRGLIVGEDPENQCHHDERAKSDRLIP